MNLTTYQGNKLLHCDRRAEPWHTWAILSSGLCILGLNDPDLKTGHKMGVTSHSWVFSTIDNQFFILIITHLHVDKL